MFLKQFRGEIGYAVKETCFVFFFNLITTASFYSLVWVWERRKGVSLSLSLLLLLSMLFVCSPWSCEYKNASVQSEFKPQPYGQMMQNWGGGLWMCATWRTAHHCSAVSTTHSVMVQIRLEICFLFHSLSGKLFSQKCYSLYLGPSPPLLDNFHLLESKSGCVIYLTLKPPRDEGWRAGEMIMWLFIRAHL